MKPIRLYNYIRVGGILEYLKRCQQGTKIHGEGFILEHIVLLIMIIENSDFAVSKAALNDIKHFKEKIEKDAENYRLTSDERSELFGIMDKLIAVIAAESKTKFNFSLTEKRIDVNKLTNDISSLFANEIFDVLPEKIQYDFKESGKCIAFECPTASAFHVLRGVEGLLRVLLNKLSPQTNVSQLNWGPIIRELRNLNISALSILLDNLDRIRANYRNPTNHPDKIYNIEEAQDLFNLCAGLINDVVTYMKKHNYI